MKQPIIFISQQHNAPPLPQKIVKPEIVILMLMFTCMVKKKNNLRSVTIFILIYKDIVTKVIISEAV